MVNNSNGQTFNRKKYHKISKKYNLSNGQNLKKMLNFAKNQKNLKNIFICN
jgi:hypothetical protein